MATWQKCADLQVRTPTERSWNLRLGSPAMVVALLLALVFLLRLPSALVPRELNVDESQALSLAMKSLVDARPWQAIDGQSVGPLNSYFLSVFLLMGAKPGFILLHVLASALVCLQVITAYLTLRKLASEKTAALGGFLMVLVYGLTTKVDYLHYAGELLPTLLLMFGFYLFLSWLEEPVRSNRSMPLGLLYAAGMALGTAPWCKLQALPITGALALVVTAAIFRTRNPAPPQTRRAAELIAFGCGMVVTSCIMLAVLTRYGAVRDFWYSYIIANMSYADRVSLSRSLAHLVLVFLVSPLHQLLLIAVIGGSLLLYSEPARSASAVFRERRWAVGSVMVYAVGAVLAVCRPRYLWPHHAIFLVPPMTYIAAGLVSHGIATLMRRERSPLNFRTVIPLLLSSAALTLYAVYAVEYVRMLRAIHGLPRTESQSVVRMPKAPPDLEKPKLSSALAGCIAPVQWSLPDSSERIAAVVRDIQKTHAVRGVAIWGWAPGVFVLTGIAPGTRDPNVSYLIKKGPLQQYYRARFAADLRANPPDVFIDAVAPDAFPAWSMWGASDGYESDPEVRSLVERNYVLVDQLTLVEGAKAVRFFARRRPDDVKSLESENIVSFHHLVKGRRCHQYHCCRL
jgi:hypothetical protein